MQGAAEKVFPRTIFWQYFPQGLKFFNKIFHAFCMFVFTQNYKILFIIFYFDKIMPY